MSVMSAVAPVLTSPDTLSFSDVDVGLAASLGLFGSVLGALLFGALADLFGRRPQYLVLPVILLLGGALCAGAWSVMSFAFGRFLSGLAIGGEYAAINSAVDELLPSRIRGRTDIALNGSYWIGAGAGAFLGAWASGLSKHGWRLALALAAAAPVLVFFSRLTLPESPRWLYAHGHPAEANAVVCTIEAAAGVQAAPEEEQLREGVRAEGADATGATPPPEKHEGVAALMSAARVMRDAARAYPERVLLTMFLFSAQAWLFNGIFHTYALVLARHYGVPVTRAGDWLLPFAAVNFAGSALLAPAFDHIGRRLMMTLTYGLSGALLGVATLLFYFELLNVLTQTLLWCLIFFVASPAASAAYLTAGELFPLRVRALAIAVFFAAGTGVGGVIAPVVFSALLAAERLVYAYWAAALLMGGAGATAALLAVDAEGKALEELTPEVST